MELLTSSNVLCVHLIIYIFLLYDSYCFPRIILNAHFWTLSIFVSRSIVRLLCQTVSVCFNTDLMNIL